MLRYLAQRLLLLLPLALLVSVFVFLLASIVPGGPVAAIVGNHPLNDTTIEALKHKYHLDEPIYQQYLRWLTRAVLHHDLGRSILTQTPVTTSITERINVTLTLNLGGIGFALLFGVPLGVIAAMRRGRALDRAVVSFTIFAGNAPAFVVSLIALYVFGLKLGWFPLFGEGSSNFVDRVRHLALPTIVLGIAGMALIMRITRAAMLEQLDQDYIVFARSRGLSARRVIVTYAFRNALDPGADRGRAAPDRGADRLALRRGGLRPAGAGIAARQLGPEPRPPRDPGPRPDRRGVDHRGEHPDRHRLRDDRPAGRLREGCRVTISTAPTLDPVSRLGTARRALGMGSSRGVPITIWLALGFLGAVIFLSIFGLLVFRGSPSAQHLLENGEGPTSAHWLGTDPLGRDVFSRMVAGSKTALIGPFIIAFSGLVVSSIVGIAAGYFGGVIDLVISRVVDFMFALPGLLIAIVVVSVVGGGYALAIAVLCVLNVQGDIRIVRSVAVKQRALPYIEAARTLGVPRWRIMYQHIFLNIIPILIANLALDFGGALIALAGLAFLGLGSPAGSPEWGRMLAEGQSLLFQNPAAALVPGLAIVLLAMSVSLIGDWVYDGYSRRGRSER